MKTEPALIILIPGFPADTSDSNCLPAQQRFVRGINRHYPRLKLVILAFQYPFNDKTYEWENNTVIAFGGNNRGGIARRLLWNRVTAKLNSLEQEWDIKGILAFWAGECALVGKRWAVKNKKKFICWAMGQDALPGNKYFKRANLEGSELVAISDVLAKKIAANHHCSPVRVVPIGIDRESLPVPGVNKDIAILCAGSLIPLKQYHLAIEVMKKVKEFFPQVNMVIAGNGPEKEILETLVTDSQLEKNIQLPGEQPHEMVLQLMSRCVVFLHPSTFEGFSMACLEALGSGAQVISFEQPMENHIANWHVVHDVNEMAEKVIAILRKNSDTQPNFPYPLKSTVKDIMDLFGPELIQKSVPLQRDCISG